MNASQRKVADRVEQELAELAAEYGMTRERGFRFTITYSESRKSFLLQATNGTTTVANHLGTIVANVVDVRSWCSAQGHQIMVGLCDIFGIDAGHPPPS